MHQFILNWCEQIHQLNELTGTQKHFSDYTKMIMLQNAVHPIQDLKQIKKVQCSKSHRVERIRVRVSTV